MNKQNQIKRTLSQPDAIEYIIGRLAQNGKASRTQLANELCVQFNFFAPNGDKQSASCLKALRELEQQGELLLPASQSRRFGQPTGQRRLDEPVPPPSPLPDEVGKIKQLKLIQVKTESQRRTWNELIIRDHPQGKRPLVGRQVRYLIKSEHGYLGGIGFSAAALHLDARDRWIGWDWAARQEGLHYVVNMSRFLIRDGVTCQNLASRVLGMAVRVLPTHFEARYGYQPLLLESFIDTRHHYGTCYKAANWQWLGQTKGRGRQDTLKQAPESIKDSYVCPLVHDFRPQLGLREDAGLGERALTESIKGEDWAEQEFGGAPLGDQRLVEIGVNKAASPGSSYRGASQGE